MKSIPGTFVLAVLIVSFVAQPLWSDTLTKKNGTVYEGKLLKKTSEQYVFEVWKRGGKMKYQVTVPANEVASFKPGEIKVVKPKPEKEDEDSGLAGLPVEPKAPEIIKYEKPTYYLIPLNGVVGKKFVARILEKSFADAFKRKPTVVVLVIDSPGGHVSEVDKLVDVIRKYKKELRVVAYVKKQAISAAAITALSVKEIYMNPSASIGGATMYMSGGDGVVDLPSDVNEKMQSIWRASARNSAETGGHDTKLAEAMIDRQMELYVSKKNGKKVIREGTPPKGAEEVTKKGKLLTMTDQEAEKFGLSLGSVENVKELGKKIGYENWTECKGLGTPLSEWWGKTIEQVEKKFKAHVGEFRDNWQRAMDSRPECFRDYSVARTGRLNKRSQIKWKSRSSTAIKLLKESGKALKKAGDLAEKYPEVLMTNPDMIRNAEKQIKLRRESIAKRANFK